MPFLTGRLRPKADIGVVVDGTQYFRYDCDIEQLSGGHFLAHKIQLDKKINENKIDRPVNIITGKKEFKHTGIFGLWLVIEDYESAIEAIRNTYVIAIMLAIFHGVLFGILFLHGHGIWSDTPKEPASLLYFVAAISVIPLWFGLRIRKRKFAVVPIVIIWGLVECLYITIHEPVYWMVALFIVVPSLNAIEATRKIILGIVKNNQFSDKVE